MSYTTDTSAPTTPIVLVATSTFTEWQSERTDLEQAWLARQAFEAKPGQHAWLPGADGSPERVAAGWDGEQNLSTLGHLPTALPVGCYSVEQPLSEIALAGWGLGAYSYTEFKALEREPATLVLDEASATSVIELVEAVSLGRDLINAPADHMLPSHLEAAFRAVGERFGAEITVTTGDALLDAGHRTIHAVGRASADAPRLLDLTWGEADAPKVTLVGKGVCFDSGGLDLKPASGMRLMKKDMGGAAVALGLAQLIMARQLQVRLRLLIPAVENAVSGNAYRPGDIIRTYKGTTVEIDNTDAEGRLVMCDALALACEEEPEFLADFATLTGSARSAVGAEIGAMFATSDDTAADLHAQGVAQDDAVWRMPLHEPYGHMLRSTVADTVNSAASPYGGAITAALFLQTFVSVEDWVHFDIMAFNNRARPGRPEGGEAMALRAVYAHLAGRYGAA